MKLIMAKAAKAPTALISRKSGSVGHTNGRVRKARLLWLSPANPLALRDKADNCRKDKINGVLPIGDDQRRHALCQIAPHHLPDGIPKSRIEREQGGGLKGLHTRPHHDDHPGKARNNGNPAVVGNAFTENGSGKTRHKERHGEIDRHHVGHWHCRNRENEGEVGRTQDEGAHQTFAARAA